MIYEDVDKAVLKDFNPKDKNISVEKRRLIQKELLKQAKNEKFVEKYEKALLEESGFPIKIKILSQRSDLKKIEIEKIKKSQADGEESKSETSEQSVTKGKITLTKEEFNKIAFVYMFRTIEEFDFEIEKITEIPSLIKKLRDLIKTKYKDVPSFFKEDGKLKNEPYNLNIAGPSGSITPITSMDHLYSIVKEFEGQSKVYFNIKPYFDIDTKAILEQ